MDIDLEKVESLLKLMQQYKVDCIQVGELKLLKTKHDFQATKDNNTASKKAVWTDEEILFHSTSNALTLKQIEDLEAGKLVLNPTKG